MKLRQILASAGITKNAMAETIPGTRFSGVLFDLIDRTIAKVVTFKVDVLELNSMQTVGQDTQLLETRPGTTNPGERCTTRAVTPYSTNSESTAVIGTSYFVGFQLAKEQVARSSANWSCVTGNLDPVWINNRNAGRRLPLGYKAQYAALEDLQEYWMLRILERIEVTKQ